MPRDIRTRAIVLHRVNYGEADRILTVLTPEGKFSVLAKSVRKEKSRLAGAIELFSVSDIVLHQGRSDLAVLTGARMIKFYSGIIGNVENLELASHCIKKISGAAEHTDSPEYFSILEQVLAGLHAHVSPALVSAWFHFNLMRATGEELNLIQDAAGNPLLETEHYSWDTMESALRPHPAGPISGPEIKFARLLWAGKLRLVASVAGGPDLIPAILPMIKA